MRLEVHQASLSVTGDGLARLKDFLSEEELKRGERLLDKERCERFLAGRGILREILGCYLGKEPAKVILYEGEFGKPQLFQRAPQPDALHFNASHAGNRLLVALSPGREVGIDLEEVRLDLDFRPMAMRYFSVREREELFGLEPAQQIAAFYRGWTRKEAYMKGTGAGFSQPSTGFDVSLLADRPALLAHRGDAAEPERWSIIDLAVQEGFCAALAVRR